MAWARRRAGARSAGAGGGEMGCGGEHILPLSRETAFTLGTSGCVTGLFGVLRPPARRAYVPVPKNRGELGRPSGEGRQGEAGLPRRGGAAGARSGACR